MKRLLVPSAFRSLAMAICLVPAVAAADILSPAGEWQILDAAGNQLGILTMDAARMGGGDIEDSQPGGGPGPVFVEPFSTSAEAFDVILSSTNLQMARDAKARLLFGRPQGGQARGSLFGTNERAQPVTLRWIGAGAGYSDDDGDDEVLFDDYPAIGIWRPEYEIVNVPPGGSVPLRAQPERNSQIIGTLPAGARAIWARQCTPEIDTEDFETADLSGRMRLLSGSWCEVEQASQSGFLPGFHLRPLD